VRTSSTAALLFAIGFSLESPARAQVASDPDPWFGADKALHFGASAVIAAGGYGLTAIASDARGVRLLVGGGAALAAGVGKELYDLAGYGDPSWRDLTWDVIGTACGLAVAYGIDLALAGVDARHPALLAPAASTRGLVVRF
jgi:putative lipoprotein